MYTYILGPAAPILFTAYLSRVFDYAGNECPGIQGLSLVDDVAWWAEGKSEQEVARNLTEAVLDWARENGVSFDKAKMEA